MNKEPNLPEGLEKPVLKYHLFLYMTGDIPGEFGYRLYENKHLIQDKKVSTLGTRGFLDLLRDVLLEKIPEVDKVNELIYNTKFVNKHIVPKME